MRSLTRDPGLADPGGVPPWTIFPQTLIHDFDTLLWLNPGAEPVRCYATADALVAPDFKAAGLLDTAVVVITFDNGAIATAEASFSAAYGYDVRGEVFGSAGMVTAGDTATHRHDPVRRAPAATSTPPAGTSSCSATPTSVSSSSSSTPSASRRPPAVTGDDARRALRVALAAIESRRTGRSARRWPRERSRSPSAPRWFTATCRSSTASGASTTAGFAGGDLGLDDEGPRRARRRAGRASPR